MQEQEVINKVDENELQSRIQLQFFLHRYNVSQKQQNIIQPILNKYDIVRFEQIQQKKPQILEDFQQIISTFFKFYDEVQSYDKTYNDYQNFKNKNQSKIEEEILLQQIQNKKNQLIVGQNSTEKIEEQKYQNIQNDINIFKQDGDTNISSDISNQTDYNNKKFMKENRQSLKIPLTYESIIEYVKVFKKFIRMEQELKDKEQQQEYHKAVFKLDMQNQKKITKRLQIYLKRKLNVYKGIIFQIKIPYKDNNKTDYIGYGEIFQTFVDKQQNFIVDVDINILSPFPGEEFQDLPESNMELFNNNELSYKIIHINYHLQKYKFILKQLKEDEVFHQKQIPYSIQQIRNTIIQATIPKKIRQSKFDQYGLNFCLQKKQLEAIKNAINSRFSLIQGPPGTGKTEVLTQIVCHWLKENHQNRILVCAPSNFAADLICERFQQIDILSNSFARFCSKKQEDVFNMKLEELKTYSLQYKMLQIDQNVVDQLFEQFIQDPNLNHIKMQLEFYFGYYYYSQNNDLKKLEDQDGFIDIQQILKKYWMNYKKKSNIQDVIEISKFTVIFELNEQQTKIRKKEFTLSDSFKIIGIDKDGIRNLTEEQFMKFLLVKKQMENYVLNYTRVIVCTCMSSQSKRLTEQFQLNINKQKKESNLHFNKVIIDEATQAEELETLLAIMNSKHVVLIGDQNQLGPVTKTNLGNTDSLFKRFIQADYPYTMLDYQYRMHPMIAKIPNLLFYNNQIQTGYKQNDSKIFINKEKPLLFINVNSEEQSQGTSFYNMIEVETVIEILNLFVKKRNFNAKRFGIIAPYQSQIQILQNELKSFDHEILCKSVDTWQGREQDYIIISCVRTTNLGFMRDFCRLNVALTRAKHGLIIIGNSTSLEKSNKWLQVLNMLKDQNVYVDGLPNAVKYINEQLDNKDNVFDDFI